MTTESDTLARGEASANADGIAADQRIAAVPPVSAPSIVPQGGGQLATAFRAASYASAGLVAEWRPLSDLAAIDDAWRALAARALEPNVFYEPDFALAAVPVFGRDVGAVLVWADVARRRLLGLFPARVVNWRAGFLLPVTRGWTHPYGPLGTPLVDRDEAPAAIAAWLDFVAQGKPLPARLLLPLVPTTGPFAEALAGALARRNGHCSRFDAHERALLAPADARGGYIERSLTAKKRKELGRQRRRLGEDGAVATTQTSDLGSIGAALEDFMALEQRGWKGKSGSAAAQNATVSAFMRGAIEALAARGQASVARLAAGGRTVAAGIVLRSGSTAWFWKIAYDEDAARASPGVQLAVDLTQAALDDPTLQRVDSCATADHPMIDHIWRERLALADHLVVVGGSPSLARASERFRRFAFRLMRALRNRLR